MSYQKGINGLIKAIMLIAIIFCIIYLNIYISSIFIGTNLSIRIISIILLITFIYTLIYFCNRLIIMRNDIKEIYIRDVESKYSPAVVSYLMNGKTEVKKDLSATLLNLCAKGFLKIEEENSKINIIDLHNDISKLSKDEKEAYRLFVSGITKEKIDIWKKIVYFECRENKFFRRGNSTYSGYLFLLFSILTIIITRMYITIENVEIIFKSIVFIYFCLIQINLIEKLFVNVLFSKSNFFRVNFYTRKGAIEYNKWKKFENFIKDFTLIKDKEYSSYVILGKYLAYSIALGINKECDSELYNKINNKYSFNLENIFKFLE